MIKFQNYIKQTKINLKRGLILNISSQNQKKNKNKNNMIIKIKMINIFYNR